MPTTRTNGRQVGVVASFDFEREEELRRWVPDPVRCSVAYTPRVSYRSNLDLVSRLNDPAVLREPARRLAADGASAVAYLCTACSFAGGPGAEHALRDAMTASGAPRALTTMTAVVEALTAVRARRVAVVHPYQSPVERLLADHLEALGFEVVSLTSLKLGSVAEVYGASGQRVRQAVRAGDRPGADAVFISCTALPTYEAVAPLEGELGKPVISANQATMWSLMRSAGGRARGGGALLRL
ncbi:maleate cis-trans isomerase family protein [Streptomyces sp. NPDC004749]